MTLFISIISIPMYISAQHILLYSCLQIKEIPICWDFGKSLTSLLSAVNRMCPLYINCILIVTYYLSRKDVNMILDEFVVG